MLPGSIHEQMVQRCEKATEQYRQRSEGKNHFLICYKCFSNDYFRKDQFQKWCTLIILCPRCMGSNWLSLGTNVSQENLDWLVEKHVSPEERPNIVYSDNIIRSFEGVVQCFLKDNIQEFRMKTIDFHERVRKLTDHDLPYDFLIVTDAPMSWWWPRPPPEVSERFKKNDVFFAGQLDMDGLSQGSRSEEKEAWWLEHRAAMYDAYNHFSRLCLWRLFFL